MRTEYLNQNYYGNILSKKKKGDLNLKDPVRRSGEKIYCQFGQHLSCVCVLEKLHFRSFHFFFFHAFLEECGYCLMNSDEQQPQMLTFSREQYIRVLFTDPQISFFINFFIKNGSHGTIYTFKNYFITVISVISFQFQQNKSYPNRPLMLLEGQTSN